MTLPTQATAPTAPPWPGTVSSGHGAGRGLRLCLVALPPCFGIPKSTAHRRFLIWSQAGVWGRLHEAVLHRLDDAGLIDVSRVVLDSAHVRAKGGGLTGPSPVDHVEPGSRMHVLSEANGLPLVIGASAPTPTTAKH